VAALTVSQHGLYGTLVSQKGVGTLISQKASGTTVSQKPDGSAGRTLVQGH